MNAPKQPYAPTHDMIEDEYGVDEWRVDSGFHNGPECRNCGAWCHHCDRERASAPCPAAKPPAPPAHSGLSS